MLMLVVGSLWETTEWWLMDQASIYLYSDVSHGRSYEDGEWVSVLKPEDVVKSLKNRVGN